MKGVFVWSAVLVLCLAGATSGVALEIQTEKQIDPASEEILETAALYEAIKAEQNIAVRSSEVSDEDDGYDVDADVNEEDDGELALSAQESEDPEDDDYDDDEGDNQDYDGDDDDYSEDDDDEEVYDDGTEGKDVSSTDADGEDESSSSKGGIMGLSPLAGIAVLLVVVVPLVVYTIFRWRSPGSRLSSYDSMS